MEIDLKDGANDLAERIAKMETVKGFKVPDKMIIPMLQSVIVQRSTSEKMETASGLIIPESAQHIVNAGVLFAVGPDVKYLREGLKVVFNSYANNEVIIDGKSYLIMSQHDIYGILPPDGYVRMDQATSEEKRKQEKKETHASYLKKQANKDPNEPKVNKKR